MAVFRLMRNSNLVGCSTGKSPAVRAFQKPVHVTGCSPKHICQIRAVSHQASRPHIFARFVHRRKVVHHRKFREPLSMSIEKSGGEHVKSLGATPDCRSESLFKRPPGVAR